MDKRVTLLENRLKQLQSGIQTNRKRRIEAYEISISTLERRFVEYKVEKDKTLENLKNTVISINNELAQENRKLNQLDTKLTNEAERLRNKINVPKNQNSMSFSRSITSSTIELGDYESIIDSRLATLEKETLEGERNYVSVRTKGLIAILQKLISIKTKADILLSPESPDNSSLQNLSSATTESIIGNFITQFNNALGTLRQENDGDNKRYLQAIDTKVKALTGLLEAEKAKRKSQEEMLIGVLEHISVMTLELNSDE